jgi:hypothetical protein
MNVLLCKLMERRSEPEQHHLPDRQSHWVRIGSGFNDFVDPDSLTMWSHINMMQLTQNWSKIWYFFRRLLLIHTSVEELHNDVGPQHMYCMKRISSEAHHSSHQYWCSSGSGKKKLCGSLSYSDTCVSLVYTVYCTLYNRVVDPDLFNPDPDMDLDPAI